MIMEPAADCELHSFAVPDETPATRLDAFIALLLPDISRSRIAELINEGFVTVNRHVVRKAKRLRGGELITVSIPPSPVSPVEPMDMCLTILYEDESLAILDKPAGLVVHPGSSTTGPTLVNGLLHRFPGIDSIGHPKRPGIVHRLDKDTSGCLIIAKTEKMRQRLIGLFSHRLVHKEYYTIVKGVPAQEQFSIDMEIGRSLKDRKKMSVRTAEGKEAITHASLVEQFGTLASALAVRIITGRTHQIRVHMAYAGLPVLGDGIYGKAARELSLLCGAARQMLHARKISFLHPDTRRELVVVSPLPDDIQHVTAALKAMSQT